MKLTRNQREIIFMKFGGKCAYCGCDLPLRGWHVDHVEPVYRKSVQDMAAAKKNIFKLKATGEVFNQEADCLENLYPSCAPCNLFKSVYSLDMFRKQIELQTERARKSSVNFRTAERFGLIELVNKPVVFWFEKYRELHDVS